MKEPIYPHFLYRFFLETVLESLPSEGMHVSPQHLWYDFRAYRQLAARSGFLPDPLSAVALDDLQEFQSLLETFTLLKVDLADAYYITRDCLPHPFPWTPIYRVRRVIEQLFWLEAQPLSGMLTGLPHTCKTILMRLYCRYYDTLTDAKEYTRPVHLELVPGSTPAQLYYQIIRALSPEMIPVRDKEGLYEPTEANLWQLRLDTWHLFENVFGGQLLLDNADRLPNRTLMEIEDLASRVSGQECGSIVVIGRNELKLRLKTHTNDHWRLTEHLLEMPLAITYKELEVAFMSLQSEETEAVGTEQPPSSGSNTPLLTDSSATLDTYLKTEVDLSDTPNGEHFQRWRQAMIKKYGKSPAAVATGAQAAPSSPDDLWSNLDRN